VNGPNLEIGLPKKFKNTTHIPTIARLASYLLVVKMRCRLRFSLLPTISSSLQRIKG
jgi:hypothetical protein